MILKKNIDLLKEQFTTIIIKFQNQASIMKIKSKYKFQKKHSFKQAPVKYV